MVRPEALLAKTKGSLWLARIMANSVADGARGLEA